MVKSILEFFWKSLFLAVCAGLTLTATMVIPGVINTRLSMWSGEQLYRPVRWEESWILGIIFVAGAYVCLIAGTPLLVIAEVFFKKYRARYLACGFVGGLGFWIFLLYSGKSSSVFPISLNNPFWYFLLLSASTGLLTGALFQYAFSTDFVWKCLLLAVCAGLTLTAMMAIPEIVDAHFSIRTEERLSWPVGWEESGILGVIFIAGVYACFIVGTPLLVIADVFFRKYRARYLSFGVVGGVVCWTIWRACFENEYPFFPISFENPLWLYLVRSIVTGLLTGGLFQFALSILNCLEERRSRA